MLTSNNNIVNNHGTIWERFRVKAGMVFMSNVLSGNVTCSWSVSRNTVCVIIVVNVNTPRTIRVIYYYPDRCTLTAYVHYPTGTVPMSVVYDFRISFYDVRANETRLKTRTSTRLRPFGIFEKLSSPILSMKFV